METIKTVETVRGKNCITFESGWQVWLDRKLHPGFSLREGVQVDRKKFEKFILYHQYPSALERAVAMLAERSRSKKEIENRLRLNRYDQEVIGLVIFKLEKENLLNDGEFSSQWVESRMKKYGPARIRMELRMKGIDPDTASGAMNLCSEDEQLKTAVILAKKKMKSLGCIGDRKAVFRKVVPMLTRRGFSWETARKAYEAALGESADD